MNLPKISEMTRELINEELIGYQTDVVERLSDHDAAHQLIRMRTTIYMNSLTEDACLEERSTNAFGQFL